MADHRKRRKLFNAPGQAHEFTFSCYRRRPFFARDANKEALLAALENARQTHNLLVWAYVIMPEHVHLVVRPLADEYDVANILQSIKQPVGRIAIHTSRNDDG